MTFRFLPCAYPKLNVRIPEARSVASSGRVSPSAAEGSCTAGKGFCAPEGVFDDREPRPPSAQLTSTPRLMLQSQTRANTGVLTSTFSTGKISGNRAGGVNRNSAVWRTIHAE